ncbi:MAG: OmpA family protein, partial [Alphaproteobacteria bacterium]|nr:OmpA family protein [Alphaproteobacteria bacterium]
AMAALAEGGRAAAGADAGANAGANAGAGASALRLATIAFAGGSARLDDNDRRTIRQVAAIQRRHGGIVRIVGHASQENANAASVRERVSSLGVSLERANVVAAEAVRAGIAPSALRIEARGDAEPVVPGTSRGADQANRRVEIFIDF